MMKITSNYSDSSAASLFHGDCRDFLKTLPEGSVQLIVTSPPYNIGKRYETRKSFDEYLADQAEVLAQCISILSPHGSICWQVGNHVNGGGEIYPLDIFVYQILKKHGLYLRNRIIWHFKHGLHCSRRFSGRYETILWFTKSDKYVFNLDPVCVQQKYPGKKFQRS